MSAPADTPAGAHDALPDSPEPAELTDHREDEKVLAESEDLAHKLLATLRSAQVDTSTIRGDLGAGTGWYSATLLTLMAVVVLWAFLQGAAGRLAEARFVADPTFMAMGTWLLASSLIVLIARAAGPLGASRAMRSWLLSTPADRAVLVRGSLRAVTTGCGAIGAAAGGFAAAVQGYSDLRILTSALLGFMTGVFMVTCIAAFQDRPSNDSLAGITGMALLGIGSLALTLGVLPGWSTVSRLELVTPESQIDGLWLDIGLTCLLTLFVWRLEGHVRQASRALSTAALARGGDFVDALGISTLMLDSTPLRAALGSRVTRRVDRHPLTRHGVAALAEVDIRRIARSDLVKLGPLAALPLPATVSALFGFAGGWAAAVLVTYLIAHNLASGLATYTGSASMRRDLPYKLPWARAALLCGPMTFAGVYALAALALARVDLYTWPILMLAVAAGVLRSAEPRDPSTAASGMASTPMGVIPLGLIRLVTRGYDLLLLPALSVAVGLPSVGLVTAAVPFAIYLLRTS